MVPPLSNREDDGMMRCAEVHAKGNLCNVMNNMLRFNDEA